MLPNAHKHEMETIPKPEPSWVFGKKIFCRNYSFQHIMMFDATELEIQCRFTIMNMVLKPTSVHSSFLGEELKSSSFCSLGFFQSILTVSLAGMRDHIVRQRPLCWTFWMSTSDLFRFGYYFAKKINLQEIFSTPTFYT